ENTSHCPPGRDNGARAARAAAPGVRPPSTTLGNPPEPVARSAEPRLSCGAWFWFGIRRVPRKPHYGGLRFGGGPPLRAPPRARLQAAAPAARPIGADRREIFWDNSRCSGPCCGRTGFPPCAVKR